MEKDKLQELLKEVEGEKYELQDVSKMPVETSEQLQEMMMEIKKQGFNHALDQIINLIKSKMV